MNVEQMVNIVIDCTDEDPPPTVVGYAYHGWAEEAKHAHEQHQQSMEMRKFGTVRIIAEVCRRLLDKKSVSSEEAQMLALALTIRSGDEELREEAKKAAAEVEAERQRTRERWGS